MRLQVSAPPPARWYGSQIPGLLLLLAAALTAALAAALAAARAACAAAGWLAGAGPCFIDRNVWKSMHFNEFPMKL